MAKVRWLAWEQESFKKAKKEKKLVLLDIFATWCHWCHQMDRLCYQHTGIVKTIHEKFVPIQIDTDKRPDINIRYNMGGWPTTCILTPEGEVVLGATYVPPENMLNFLQEGLRRHKGFKPTKRKITAEKGAKIQLEPVSKKVMANLEQAFDPKYGGFGVEPKFTHPHALFFLLNSKSLLAKKMLVKTLDSMARNELWDMEEGGFYRYAVQQDWSTPHYEKLLEDNMQLALAYLLAYKKFNKPLYRNMVVQTLDFCTEILFNFEEGRYYGSQDADEEYCKLPLRKRKKRLPPSVDRTTYTPAQAQAIITFAAAAKMLKSKKYLQRAKNAHKFLEKCKIGGLYGHYYDKKINPPMLAIDQISAIEASLALYDTTRSEEYLKTAEKAAANALKTFGNNGIYDISEDKKAVGEMKRRILDLEENSRWALVLLELAKKTKKKKYKTLAVSALQAVTPKALASHVFATTYAIAVEKSRR